MQEDTLGYDSLNSRPLPAWLKNQKEGLTQYKPREIVIKEDHSLDNSFIITGLIIVLIVGVLTFWLFKKNRKRTG